MEFNQKLQALVDTLNNELSGLQLVLANPYGTLYDIVQNPRSYGKFEKKIHISSNYMTYEANKS